MCTTKKEQIEKCISAMQKAMKDLSLYRDIWQNELLYQICKAVEILLQHEYEKFS